MNEFLSFFEEIELNIRDEQAFDAKSVRVTQDSYSCHACV